MMTMENPALAVLVGFLTSFVGNVCATETGLAPKVQLGVFVETLCPACAHFTKEQLPKLFVNNISDIFDLSLIPWGNAKMTKDGPMCQHGSVECQLNRKMSCFKHFHRDQEVLMQYVACSEGYSALAIDSAANKCIRDMGLDLEEIQACENGMLGKQLQLEAFNTTAALQPPHLWVPWVVVNGQPLFEDTQNVQQYVCAAYTGTRPEACSKDPNGLPFYAANQIVGDDDSGVHNLRGSADTQLDVADPNTVPSNVPPACIPMQNF